MNGPSYVFLLSHEFPNKSNTEDGGHIEFRKKLISPHDTKIFAQNWIQRWTAQRENVQLTKNGTVS